MEIALSSRRRRCFHYYFFRPIFLVDQSRGFNRIPFICSRTNGLFTNRGQRQRIFKNYARDKFSSK